eukprot:1512573-Amphidinium_carterae.1
MFVHAIVLAWRCCEFLFDSACHHGSHGGSSHGGAYLLFVPENSDESGIVDGMHWSLHVKQVSLLMWLSSASSHWLVMGPRRMARRAASNGRLPQGLAIVGA